jgi:hypothetical protein
MIVLDIKDPLFRLEQRILFDLSMTTCKIEKATLNKILKDIKELRNEK